MTRLPIPASIGQRIAERAVQYAREDVRARGWQSSGALQPLSGQGEVGITSTVKYLLHQNKGISPFVMYWVEGRTVPMSCKQGDGPHFRTGRAPGQPGWADIPHRGKVWRNQKWRHPGLKPKRFIESAIQRAIRESHDEIQTEMMRILRGGQ